jgi:hypothetical protein
MKTHTQHTPGPWTENEGFICARFSDGEVHDICDPRCAPPTDDLIAEMDANARLIAAAPELLQALELIHANAAESVEWIRRHTSAAIAKARGDNPA